MFSCRVAVICAHSNETSETVITIVQTLTDPDSGTKKHTHLCV